MKKLLRLLLLAALFQSCSTKQSIFELSPQQSMSITGKGAGQDAAYNPYGNAKSISVVKNIGKTSFAVRVQKNDEVSQNVEVNPKETKEFVLDKGDELYLDSEQKAKADVTFKKFD